MGGSARASQGPQTSGGQRSFPILFAPLLQGTRPASGMDPPRRRRAPCDPGQTLALRQGVRVPLQRTLAAQNQPTCPAVKRNEGHTQPEASPPSSSVVLQRAQPGAMRARGARPNLHGISLPAPGSWRGGLAQPGRVSRARAQTRANLCPAAEAGTSQELRHQP